MSNNIAIEKIKTKNWAAFSQPDGNSLTEIADSLIAICRTNDAASSSSAYSKFLYSIGNNHAGTYYPVLLETIPILEQILILGSGWPARTVLCVLDDLFASFHPELGFETVVDSSGKSINVECAFRDLVINLQPVIASFATDNGPDSKIANSLLELIHEHVT